MKNRSRVVFLDHQGEVAHMDHIVLFDEIPGRCVVDIVAAEADVRREPLLGRGLVQADVQAVEVGRWRVLASQVE